MTPPTDNRPRVFSCGSWIDTTATDVRAAYRYVLTPSYRSHIIGFRTTQCGCRQILKVTP